MNDSRPQDSPTIAEDLLLLLFQPDSGTIAGENTLFYVLGGAVLAQLGLEQRVTTKKTWSGTVNMAAVPDRAPSDEILRAAWTSVQDKPRGVQTVLPAIGPTLRQPLIDRLVARGELRTEAKKTLGIFSTTVLKDGGTGRRNDLLAEIRGVLVDGASPSARTAALTGLLSASGTLPQFHPAIPWKSAVITRAEELERGDWGAAGAGEAVERTVMAMIVNSVTVTTIALR
ncbi:GOLPH3/VPS74 family protein [Microbacterium invictum]|uniref:GPP34 family phosphoprotein n=1 Tax=Microbacterium invictum TaxID=515415 RepID=A0ABZ0V898_9MICO|nr:GPP34 family phosphoprotein [Microbacterium invictum]WQB69850.1 GPP34 family phosphoprotein [Microbacterium invictum]